MKAVAIVSEYKNKKSNQWQFDKIMSAIAYDMDLSVVFMPGAIKQITKNKAWNSLALYGIDAIYFLNSHNLKDYQTQLKLQEINIALFNQLIHKADIVL